jgi:hypothetical protein
MNHERQLSLHYPYPLSAIYLVSSLRRSSYFFALKEERDRAEMLARREGITAVIVEEECN